MRVGRREARGKAARTRRPLFVATAAVALLAAVGAAGCGGSGDRDLESLLKWQPGDYRTLPDNFCERFAQGAGSLIPSEKPPIGGSQPHQATCHWTTTGDRFRELSFLVTVAQPDPIDHVPAVGVATQGFGHLVELKRDGISSREQVKQVHPVPGLGDQATAIYGVADDNAVVETVMRQRNIEVTITLQAADVSYRNASDGSGVLSTRTPLSQPVVENVATETSKHILALLPPPQQS